MYFSSRIPLLIVFQLTISATPTSMVLAINNNSHYCYHHQISVHYSVLHYCCKFEMKWNENYRAAYIKSYLACICSSAIHDTKFTEHHESRWFIRFTSVCTPWATENSHSCWLHIPAAAYVATCMLTLWHTTSRGRWAGCQLASYIVSEPGGSCSTQGLACSSAKQICGSVASI